MATYTVTNGRLVCTGTDITSDGIKTAIDGDPSVGTAEKLSGDGNSSPIFKFKAEISIGDNLTDSTWKITDEYINVYADFLIINGANAKLQCGQLDANSKAQNTSCFTYSCSANTRDRFRLDNGGGLYVYGGYFKVTAPSQNFGRIRRSPTSPIYMQDAEVEIEDGVQTTGASSAIYSFIKCRVHHTNAVGIKLQNVNTSDLSGTRIEGCNFAIQPFTTPIILKDIEVDANTNHLIPNLGNAGVDVTFVNPDFTVLRASNYDASDTTTLAFRYNFKVQDTSLAPLQDARVYITDEQGDVVVNKQLTDSSGLINSHLFNYDGDICLQNGTFSGITRTVRATHTRLVFKYGFLLRSDTLIIDEDTKDFVPLSSDINITEPNKSVVDGYTEISSPERFYDRASSFLEDNLGTYTGNIVSRSGNSINAGSYDVVVDDQATDVFAFDGTTITIKTDYFVGNIQTTGSITLKNNAGVLGTYGPNTVLPWEVTNVEATATLQLYNITKVREVENGIVTGTAGSKVTASGTYTGQEVSVGDNIRLRITCQAGTSAFLPYETFGVATSVGISFIADQQPDTIYNQNGINADNLTTLSADYPNVQIDISDGDGIADAREFYAFYVKQTTTSTGIEQWFGAIDAIDHMNYRVNTAISDIKLQNRGNTPLVISGARIFRDNGTSILHADVGDQPMTQDNGELIQYIKGQVDKSLEINLPPAIASDPTISGIDKNSKLIPALL